MNRLSIPIIAACLLFVGGCSSRFDHLHYDNPKIRGLQSEQVRKFLPTTADRVAVMKLISPRVGFLDCGDAGEATIGSGRAAAITSDGYYLTASHVIEDSTFSLTETTIHGKLREGVHLLAKEEMERLIKTRSYPGRVVWRNGELDLAIVKFEKRSPKYFKSMSGDVAEGLTLYSADDSGLGVFVTDRNGVGEMLGNGPFLVAGSVTSNEHHGNPPDDFNVIHTDIFVRGGMSGAPLADRRGILRGIILHVEVNHRRPGESRAVASMISSKRIRQIIAEDRRGRGLRRAK